MSDPAATKKIESALVDPSGYSLPRAGIIAMLPVLAIVLVGIAGHATSSLKPLVIQAFVQSVGFDKATAGYLLTAEMISTSAGSILATAFPFALRRRWYLFFALTLLMGANLASMAFKSDPGTVLYGLRCLSGLGAGFGLGRLGILIALSGRPGKTAALYSTSTQLYGAAAAFAMPFINRLCGGNSIFVILAGTVPLALVLIAWIPESHEKVAKKKMVANANARRLGLGEKSVLAVTFGVFYLGVGTFWPFISVLGETAAISHTQMSAVLGWSAIVSAVGSAMAVFAGDRKGSASTITLFFIALCLAVAMQSFAPRSLVVFVSSALLFAFAYWVINPMILGVLSKLDTTGQMNGVYYIVAVGGISLGPAVAGWILTHGSNRFSSAEFLRVASVLLLAVSSAVQIYYAYRARHLPD
ncbi:MFS transporter [Burkholderia savannae]|uniref:MFS transporter n=1 Tax=Burkholderia savannae TaxID=1637837 RepID=UPI00075B7B72|nr:MFS transporter [Burkholderia savannae]AOJ84824.1 MFS transporter [Burkholderia savannae]